MPTTADRPALEGQDYQERSRRGQDRSEQKRRHPVAGTAGKAVGYQGNGIPKRPPQNAKEISAGTPNGWVGAI